jgi:hypothetical protein
MKYNSEIIQFIFRHLSEEHECNQYMINNYEFYIISQLYDDKFIWCINGVKKDMIIVKDYQIDCNKYG